MNYIFSLENTIKTQIIFGFLDLNWDLIVSQFRAVNIEVSGGSNSKKHLFSPNHLKLSQFLLCLLGDQTNEEVVESFHNTSKIHLSKYINYDHKIAKGFFKEHLKIQSESVNTNTSKIKKLINDNLINKIEIEQISPSTTEGIKFKLNSSSNTIKKKNNVSYYISVIKPNMLKTLGSC